MSRMAVGALSMGLTWQDLRHMKYTHLMQLLWEWDEQNGADVTEYTEATGADVRALMNL